MLHTERENVKNPLCCPSRRYAVLPIRVPVSLHSVIQRAEIVQTLGTQNRQEAIPTALELASKAKTVFNKLSRDMKNKELYEQILNGLGDEQFDAIGTS